MEAKIKDMSTWTDSDHNAVIAKIYLGHLIEKKSLSTIKQREQKRTIYLYDKASEEDWENYAMLLQRLQEGNQNLNNLEGEEMNNNTGKKELDYLWDIIQNAIIKAANQTLPKKKILNTGCSRKRSKVKTELEKSILVLGKIIRGICDGKVSQLNSNTVVSANSNISYINKKLNLEIGLLQPQSLEEGEQDLCGWKKILEKKCLTENTISSNKKIQEKVEKRCEMIVNNQGQMLVSLLNKPYNKIIINKLVLEKQDHSRELITKPEEVMSITEKHFQNQYQ